MLKPSENTGIKMTVRRIFAGHSSEQTIYLQKDRKRTEFRNDTERRKPDGSHEWLSGPRLAAIKRCDLGQAFELNLDAGEYVSSAYPPKPLTQAERKARGLSKSDLVQSGKPTLRIETNTVDTGERKEFFGRVARHVITTRRQIPLEGSHTIRQETITDGWYIDLDTQLSCERKWSGGRRGHVVLILGGQPAEKTEFVDIGEPETGFAVQLVRTSKSTDTLRGGSKKGTNSKHETLVARLELAPLDPRLFEIPAGFKHVQRIDRNP